MRSDPLSLEKIEQTLDAIARTPTKHRAELRLQVNLPALQHVFYQSLPQPTLLTAYTKIIQSLGQMYASLNISEDPYVLYLINENTDKSREELEGLLLHHKTKCQRQIKTLHLTSLKICHEMGAYGADRYISEVIAKCLRMRDENDSFLGIWDLSQAEKLYIAEKMSKVKLNVISNPAPAAMIVSDKVSKLIDMIVAELPTIQAIVFVQTRAEVAILCHILSIHPRTRRLFKIGTMVGTSTNSLRAKNLGELIDVKSQKHTLSLFKRGIINLVIATSVLEEGIDVPACNVVICFQKPANLKSFVQRRGRARHRESKLILLLDPKVEKVNNWQQLEADMKRLYEDELRALNEDLMIEDAERHDGREFRVANTGALLDLDNAMAHVYHFCSTLPANDYVDLRPDFICSKESLNLIRCRLILPISVNEGFRSHESRTLWESEKNAMKDAAFEAYVALYKAGLISDNLLPLLRHDAVIDELFRSEVEKRAAIMEVKEQMNPWVEVAKARHDNTWKSVLTLKELVSNDFELASGAFGQAKGFGSEMKAGIYLPVTLPPVKPFPLYWNLKSEVSVTVSHDNLQEGPESLLLASEITRAILEASFGTRFQVDGRNLPIQFSLEEENPLRVRLGYEAVCAASQLESYSTVIRDNMNNNVPYQYIEWLSRKPPIGTVQNPYDNYDSIPTEIPHLSVVRILKRSDYLHKLHSGQEPTSTKKHSAVLPITHCNIDNVSFRVFQFGKSIPSIIRRFEITLIADQLSKTLLKDVGINNLDLVVTAISASSAREESNYQRLEFLGDSILKSCTSVQLIAEYPLWHEGYLSAKKDRLVSNSRLSRAAIESGLDKFIVTKPFTGLKWQPPFIEDLLNTPSEQQKRSLSSKVLADVVEALVGASMVDGGIPKALRCLQVFLPELSWQSLNTRQEALFQRVPDAELPATLQLLQELIGYTFKKKALLIESMTHASSTTGSLSLERLEFLGDSILDNIVVTAMWKQEPELSHFQMHLLRTVLVNADFLAFICMEWVTEREQSDLVEVSIADANGKIVSEFREVSTKISIPLWRFMRHMSPKLGAVQVATAKRHAGLRDEINHAIQHGTHYPWAFLAKLQAQKFYSDLVESLLGAVWIDSGSMDVCQEIVERMGILPYMRRILKEKVQIWHPKEEIGVLAETEAVKYVIERRKVESSEDEEGREYLCKVFVGDEEIVEMGGGVSKEEVKTKAAERAVQVLKARKLKRSNDVGLIDKEGMEDREQSDTDTVMEM